MILACGRLSEGAVRPKMTSITLTSIIIGTRNAELQVIHKTIEDKGYQIGNSSCVCGFMNLWI